MSDDIPVAQRQTALAPKRSLPGRPGDIRDRKAPKRGLWIISILAGVLLLGITITLGWLGSTPSPSTAELPLPAETGSASPVANPDPVASPESIRPTILGHYAYPEADSAVLQPVGNYHGRPVRLQPSAAQAFLDMQATARSQGIKLVPISGFRTIQEQDYLFFQRAQEQALRPQERAIVSAPPGYSEHHTGYAIDIGDAQAPHTDTEITFGETAAFTWLEANAARFGFELSFLPDNVQGVSYEPWHWRFVGDRASLETFYSPSEDQSPLSPAQAAQISGAPQPSRSPQAPQPPKEAQDP